jgi:hypothetical protein
MYLSHGDIHESLSSGVHYIQQPHNGGTIVGDGGPLAVKHQLVHTTRTERGLHGFRDRLACIDIGNNLGLTLGGISTLPEQDNLGLESCHDRYV